MIRSFGDKATAALHRGESAPKRLPAELIRRARIKLEMIDAAANLADLRIPPANRLEKLRGDRAGQHSIRINDQWRVCLTRRGNDAFDVHVVDYHRG